MTELPRYLPEARHMHRHGTSEPGWIEHSHLGGGVSHQHDPETGMQVPVTSAWNAAVEHSRANPAHILGPHQDADGSQQIDCITCGWDSASVTRGQP